MNAVTTDVLIYFSADGEFFQNLFGATSPGSRWPSIRTMEATTNASANDFIGDSIPKIFIASPS